MRLKELKMILSELNDFSNPKVKYEQYSLGCDLASDIIYTIESSYGDISNRCIADLGCGPGILSIASALIGANYVCAFDIDYQALNDFKNNLSDLNIEQNNCIDLVQIDILNDNLMRNFEKQFDIVVMNPPFGTKNNKGIDMEFLKRAFKLSTECVYSLHKSATRKYIINKANDWNIKCEVIAELKYDLPATYKFHKKSSVDIDVDLIRFIM